MVKRIRTKKPTMIYKTLRRKLTIEQHEANKCPRIHSSAAEGM